MVLLRQSRRLKNSQGTRDDVLRGRKRSNPTRLQPFVNATGYAAVKRMLFRAVSPVGETVIFPEASMGNFDARFITESRILLSYIAIKSR